MMASIVLLFVLAATGSLPAQSDLAALMTRRGVPHEILTGKTYTVLVYEGTKGPEVFTFRNAANGAWVPASAPRLDREPQAEKKDESSALLPEPDPSLVGNERGTDEAREKKKFDALVEETSRGLVQSREAAEKLKLTFDDSEKRRIAGEALAASQKSMANLKSPAMRKGLRRWGTRIHDSGLYVYFGGRFEFKDGFLDKATKLMLIGNLSGKPIEALKLEGVTAVNRFGDVILTAGGKHDALAVDEVTLLNVDENLFETSKDGSVGESPSSARFTKGSAIVIFKD